MRISDMKVNGKTVQEAKLNNKIVYRKETSVKNIIYNADFRFGTDGFKKFVNMVVQQEIEDGFVAWVKLDNTNARTSMIVQLTEDLIAGHRYYGRVTFRGSEDTMYQWQQQLNSPNLTQSYGENSPNEVTISTIFAEITTQYRLFYNMTATFANAESKAYVKDAMLIDVTDMLNSGLTEEQVKSQLDAMPFFADTTPPEYVQIQVYNKNNTSSTTITNGETVRILATFNTELGTLPTLSIGKQKILMKATSDGKGGIIYQADITIASDNIMEEGVLKFTISGYTDKNGNEGEKVTEANARNSLTYYA
jgi:hypothetical protein|uniref:Uncharacterized protein n=1 Tax=Myoviridae sp. ct8mY9 TaxID=2827664 RepID=A0A8S5SEK8_9CAUD|nr:MAG TPA: hypothetical protein [Myoviridae sp. ct8mY9]